MSLSQSQRYALGFVLLIFVGIFIGAHFKERNAMPLLLTASGQPVTACIQEEKDPIDCMPTQASMDAFMTWSKTNNAVKEPTR